MRHISRILTALFLVALSTAVQAKVKGQCANCHTMHNSQENLPVTVGDDPILSLLLDDCVGCHSGTNTSSSTTPYVLDTDGPLYDTTGTEAGSNTLAGGNFYWVSQGSDRTGHNILGLADADVPLANSPPGGDDLTGQLRCAGSLGCHGDQSIDDQIVAMRKTHHFKDHTLWQDGGSLADSYRFLDTIQGLGDPEYEYHPTPQQHNKYFGKDRISESDDAVNEGTMSSQCARCHEYFHNGAGRLVPAFYGSSLGGGVWIRHPVDFDMSRASSSTEYQSYNGGSGADNPYSVIAPLATADADDSTDDIDTVYTKPDDAVVMCLSCHRAHGTPYDGILRWDYKSWPGVGGYNGCAVCHTSKD